MPADAEPSAAGAHPPALGRALGAALAGGLRLLFLRPVPAQRFAASAELWLALVLIELGSSFLVAFARVGFDGMFDPEALPRLLVYVPLALAVGVACARIGRDATLALRVPVAAATLNLWFAPVPLLIDGLASVDRIVLHFPQAYFHAALVLFVWWAAALVVALVRLVPAGATRRSSAAAYGLALLVLPGYFMPASAPWVRAYDPTLDRAPDPGVVAEQAFYAQPALLERELDALLPSRPGLADVYVLTAALYAGEDVFMKEVEVVTALLRDRYDAAGRTVSLVNHPRRAADAPIATLTSLRRALAAIGSRMDRDEDLLVLYLTSHGSERHRLAVSYWPLKLDEIDPAALRAALDDAGIRWRVVIVSACYSGGFVEPLRDEASLVITAASATRQSFGCGAGSDFTWLAKALFDEELRRTLSFEEAFAGARETIARREREQGYRPSEPQLHVGAAIRGKLADVERRLAAGRGAAP